jgi:hypothetical protein
MNKYDMAMVAFVWFLSLAGALFCGHEFGVINGRQEAKQELGHKLENCNKQIAGIKE